MRADKTSRLPLQVTISALFISLSILLGVLLSLHNYKKASDILLTSAHQVYDRLAEELILDIKGSYMTLAGVLKMIAISPVTTANTLAQRLEHLETFTITLDNHPEAANLYIGYANGDFFNVQSTR